MATRNSSIIQFDTEIYILKFMHIVLSNWNSSNFFNSQTVIVSGYVSETSRNFEQINAAEVWKTKPASSGLENRYRRTTERLHWYHFWKGHRFSVFKFMIHWYFLLFHWLLVVGVVIIIFILVLFSFTSCWLLTIQTTRRQALLHFTSFQFENLCSALPGLKVELRQLVKEGPKVQCVTAELARAMYYML